VGDRVLKALSIRQPWAGEVALGRKTIETRTWRTPHRGALLIVSSRRPRIEPAGCALAVVDLVECRPMLDGDEEAAMCRVYPRAISWVFENARPVEPFPVRGALGVYETGLRLERVGDTLVVVSGRS